MDQADDVHPFHGHVVGKDQDSFVGGKCVAGDDDFGARQVLQPKHERHPRGLGVKARDLLAKGPKPNVVQGPHKELNAAEDDGELENAEDGTDKEEDHHVTGVPEGQVVVK